MQFLSEFLDIVIIANFQGKNIDVSRTHRVCLVIYIFCIFFRKGITEPSFINVGNL